MSLEAKVQSTLLLAVLYCTEYSLMAAPLIAGCTKVHVKDLEVCDEIVGWAILSGTPAMVEAVVGVLNEPRPTAFEAATFTE